MLRCSAAGSKVYALGTGPAAAGPCWRTRRVLLSVLESFHTRNAGKPRPSAFMCQRGPAGCLPSSRSSLAACTWAAGVSRHWGSTCRLGLLWPPRGSCAAVGVCKLVWLCSKTQAPGLGLPCFNPGLCAYAGLTGQYTARSSLGPSWLCPAAGSNTHRQSLPAPCARSATVRTCAWSPGSASTAPAPRPSIRYFSAG